MNIINRNGAINYGELKRQTNAVINGDFFINSLSPAEEQGRTKGARRNVEASILLGANEGAISPAPRNEKRNIQESLLETYSKKERVWFNPNDFSESDAGESGSEALVFASPEKGYIRKVINYQIFSDTPLDFLNDRISLHNYLFPDTSYKLVGFTRLNSMGKTKNPFCFVVEQPFVIGRKFEYDKDYEHFRNYAKWLGFKVKVEMFKPLLYNKDYVVKDLHEGNIIVTSNGRYRFIDTVTYLNTLELGYGGTREYGDGRVTKY